MPTPGSRKFIRENRPMPAKTRRTGPVTPTTDPTGCQGAAPAGGVDRDEDDRRVMKDFGVAAARLHDNVCDRLDEARDEQAEFAFDLDFARGIADLRASMASIRKLEHALGDLKKVMALRVKDIQWFRDSLDRGPSRGHEE